MTKYFLPIILLSTTLYATTPVHKSQEALMRLSLDVMLYNHDLKHALQIAQKGIAQYGEKPYWLKKAAQIALWMGKSQLAKTYYQTLYRTTTTSNSLQALLKLASATQDYALLIKLQEDLLNRHFDPKTVTQLYHSYHITGALQRGVRFFRDLYLKHPHQAVLKSLLLLEMDLDAFATAAKDYLLYRKQFGLDTTLLYRYAKILFAQKAFKQAFIEISCYRDTIPLSAIKLWQLYSDLALVLNNETTLLHTLKYLDDNAQLPADKVAIYLKLLQQYDPKKALHFAQKEYRKYPNSNHFFTLGYLAIEQQAWSTLQSLLTNLTPSLRATLEKNPHYYRIKARLALHNKSINQALQAYRLALSLAPNNPQVHQEYLWSLIESDYPHALEGELYYIKNHLPLSPQLALPVALGYFQLGSTQDALPIISRLHQIDPHNWQTMLLYADILALAGKYSQKTTILHKAWELAKNEIKDPSDPTLSPRRRYDYLRLALMCDAQHKNHYLQIALNMLKYDHYIDLALLATDTITGKTQSIALLRTFKRKTPAQRLSLALLEYDKTTMQKILTQYKTLPLSDKLAAQKIIGHEQTYLSTLFHAIQNNPHNATYIRHFTTEIVNRGAGIQIHTSYTKRHRLQVGHMQIKTNRFKGLTSRWSLQYHYDHYHDTSNRDTRHTIGLSLYQRYKNLKTKFTGGITTGKESLITATLHTSYDTNHYHLASKIAYRNRDETNNYLLVYGYKDSIQFSGTWYLNSYESIHLQNSYNHYYDYNHSLGFGLDMQLAYTRYVYLNYPDVYYRLFLEGSHFNSHNTILPQDYWQSGFVVGLGESMRNRFSLYTRPYTAVTLFYNNRTQLGYSIHLGLHRQLFGKDTLGIEGIYSHGTRIRQEDLLQLRLHYYYW